MIEHLSYSQIGHYLSCQRSYRYKYINEIPTDSSDALLFGSAWHKMISMVLVDQTPQMAWGKAYDETFNPEKNNHLNSDLWELGVSMINATLSTLQGLRPLPVYEFGSYQLAGKVMIDHYVEFNIPGVPVPIIGYIDMVDIDKVPVDFKTASRKWTQAQADASLQPTFYLAGLHSQKFLTAKDFPAKFRYIIFTKKPPHEIQIIETTRTAEDILNLFGLIGDCWQSIQNGSFLPTGAGSWKCSQNYCDFYDRCMGGMKDEI